MLSLSKQLCERLYQLTALIQQLDGHAFTHRSASTGSVGEHCRHLVDHVEALTREDGVLDYDARSRGTADERSPQAALARIERLISALRELAPADRPLVVKIAVGSTPEGRPLCTLDAPSTLVRELAFVLSHTVHHMATIRMLAETHGYKTESSFGLAPATIRYRHRQRVASS